MHPTFPPLLHFCREFLTVFKLCHFFLYLGSSLLPVEGILSPPNSNCLQHCILGCRAPVESRVWDDL